jgi:hypothetical protein
VIGLKGMTNDFGMTNDECRIKVVATLHLFYI